MKVLNRKKGKSLIITFGEKSEQAKVNKILSTKASSKAGKKITSQLYQKGRFVEKVFVTVKNGYSKSYARKIEKNGGSADTYSYFTMPTELDIDYTPKNILQFIGDTMQTFLDRAKGSQENYKLKALPRIVSVSVDYIYM